MTPWTEALSQLRALGYEIAVNGGKLTYAYQGKDFPSPDQVIALIEVLKAHKQEIINDPYFLLSQTLREINEAWVPGTLEWVKRTNPNDFERMVAFEGDINRIALEGNVNRLVEALRNYKELMISVAEAFKAPKGETADLFQQG
jgi:hypothetical protein